MPERSIELVMPVGGMNRRGGLQSQPPFTTPLSRNYRPRDPLSERSRGGPRACLDKAWQETLGAGNPVNLLNQVRVVTLLPLSWADGFSGIRLGDVWETLGALVKPTMGPYPGGDPAVIRTAFKPVGGVVGAVRKVFGTTGASGTFDPAQPYECTMTIIRHVFQGVNAGFNNVFTLYTRLNDATPSSGADGIWIEVTFGPREANDVCDIGFIITKVIGNVGTVLSTQTFNNYAYKGEMPLRAVMSGTTLTVYLDGILRFNGAAVLGAGAGHRIGFLLGPATGTPPESQLCYIDDVSAKWYSPLAANSQAVITVAAANGTLYKADNVGSAMNAAAGTRRVAPLINLRSVDYLQKLYMADRGLVQRADTGAVFSATDGVIDASGNLTSATIGSFSTAGANFNEHMVRILSATGSAIGVYRMTGLLPVTLSPNPGAGSSVSFRLERGMKIYDPIADTLVLWQTTVGAAAMPLGCELITRFLDRLVVASDPITPHMWVMFRQGNPLDVDTGANPLDPARAFSYQAADLSLVGQPIRALIPWRTEVLLFGCISELWAMKGNPLDGGFFENVSYTAGVVDAGAWCLLPDESIVFLSPDGLYRWGGGTAESISREALPQELRDIDRNLYRVNLVYDPRERGIHITQTGVLQSLGNYHWYFDWMDKGYHADVYDPTQEPMSVLAADYATVAGKTVLYGSRDGKIRKFNPSAMDDDGVAMAASVLIGPVRLWDELHMGVLKEINASLAQGSNAITWELYAAATLESAVAAAIDGSSPFATGTWTAGLNAPIRQRMRGYAFVLKLSGGARWAVEQIVARISESGMRRVA